MNDGKNSAANNANNVSEANTIGEALKGIADLFKRKISFDEYLDATGDVIDKKIIEICGKEKIRFIGGSCTFRASKDAGRLSGKLELFFQDAFNNWVKKEQGFSAPISVFKEEDITKRIEPLYSREMKIGIDPPSPKGK